MKNSDLAVGASSPQVKQKIKKRRPFWLRLLPCRPFPDAALRRQEFLENMVFWKNLVG